ncbi:DNA repair protein RecO [Paraconexibacter algicola]|uniref:DNA repair protein RecO n=1 Tax=Paraconexibacter algicola TaxID=2133960 RepID=A0A2T4UC64_9ACTN|nr:DNA repair protein RecO [Paraconexibacter algicola]PTL54796.1 DNA repair protein RecO [Paraconexibacter algicola]
MPGPVKTEAVVLRSMRFGEADRILHLYTPGRGRVGAIAKGVRRARSRFGGRLEPFGRVDLVLHEGRSDLLTVTGAQILEPHRVLREDGRALDAAGRACDAVARLFEHAEPQPEVYRLLCHELTILDRAAAAPEKAAAAGFDHHANQLAFRLKLLHAGGFAPQLTSCAQCGEVDHLSGFSGAAGGVVCSSCEAGAFPLAQDAYGFLTDALAAPLARAPQAPTRALAQAERAIGETVEHHAGVHLRSARPVAP